MGGRQGAGLIPHHGFCHPGGHNFYNTPREHTFDPSTGDDEAGGFWACVRVEYLSPWRSGQTSGKWDHLRNVVVTIEAF